MLPSNDQISPVPVHNALEFCLDRLANDPEPPMFSSRLLELLSVGVEQEAPAKRLAAVVLDDYGLTLRVLRVANSFYFNRSNRHIESVTHAIVVLGLTTVQKLASSLAFFEHFEQRSSLLQHVLVRAMLSAHVAGITAEVIKNPRREEVYLAGMFQNLGEVLVARCLPQHYARIQERVDAGCPANEACVKEVGFAYHTLAKAAGRLWKFPPQFSALWEPKATSEVALIARFGTDATRLMCRDGDEERQAGIRLLVIQYGFGLKLSEPGLEEIWDRAVEETMAMFSAAGVTLDPKAVPSRTGKD